MDADLHCHSKMSDGSMGIDELVLLAKRLGLTAIALTDHDTFAGVTRAQVFGKRHGVTVLSGMELSTWDTRRGRKAHILCYGCQHPGRLEGLCKKTGDSRRRAAEEMLKKVLKLYPIAPEIVVRRAQGSTNIFKQHIMQALLEAGYADGLFGEVYQKLFHPQTGDAYVPVEYPDVHEGIRRIHEAGGIAVMAHPGEYHGMELLVELAEKKEIDGVEVWHPRNPPALLGQYQEIAQRVGLLMTGGTDFHGLYTQNHLPLGSFGAPEEQAKKLKALCGAANR